MSAVNASLRPRGFHRTSVLDSPSSVLFLALFASQTGVLVMSPILGEIAAEYDVSIAEAGQLRILAAPLAAVVAVVAGWLLVRLSPRALIASGSALLAAGSIASAAAPSFYVLAVAQVPMWAGVATMLAAGIAATAAWSEPERRTKVVAHALAGPPTAWIVGMPIIGVVAEVNWRLAFLVLPLPAALLAGLGVARRPRDIPIAGAQSSLARLLRRRDARRWALAELLANASWAGTLVFSGALFTEVHGISHAATGLALATAAVAFLAGNQWAGRGDPARARRAMLEASVAGALAVALLWAYAPSVPVSLVLFSVAAFVVATRSVSGTVYGFSLAGELRREVGAIRAATMQLGYLLGSLLGGATLALGGFETLALVFGGMLLASTLLYACIRTACRAQVGVQPAQ